MGSTRTHRQLSVLIAHRDAAWVDQAKQRLETVGYKVTDCLEPEWAADLLQGSRPYDLACISSELDAASQAAILRMMQKKGAALKLVLLLDELDSASINIRKGGGLLTYRISGDIQEFVKLVVDQLGIPVRPRL
jgi:DNA-binding NtrC family response regulator